MKADVKSASAPAPQLHVPSWVSAPIAQYVKTEYAADVDRIYKEALRENGYFDDVDDDAPLRLIDELVHDPVNRANVYDDRIRDELADITDHYRPLVCDPRMKWVWRELYRQRDGAFLHPALCPPKDESHDPDDRHVRMMEDLERMMKDLGIELSKEPANAPEPQDAAMIELFKVALDCRRGCDETPTRVELEQERDQLLALADELKLTAIMMSVSGNHERYQKLLDAVQACKDHAGEISFTGAFERKHDTRAHWVAMTIGNTFRRLLGSSNYKLTATITAVILGREINPRTVRQWCDSLPHPAFKGPKIAR